MRTTFRQGLALAALVSLASAGAARAADAPTDKCQMALLGEMKVDFAHDRPMLEASVNGHPIRALADTGASVTMMTRSTAKALGLPMDDLPNFHLYGAGGVTQAQSALVNELKIGSYTAHGVHLIAAGEGRQRQDMLLGQDFWGQADVEFDLPHGVIRFLKPNRACGDADMAYWAKAGQAYSVAPMLSGEDSRRKVLVRVALNGKPVRAAIDSGAQRSVATLRVADRIGVSNRTAEGKGVGIGGAVESYIGKLDSFTVGDETINNTRLLFSDLFGGVGFSETGSRISKGAEDAPEMLLGADFMNSHHLLISQARHAVYFTYEGGPVFDTRGTAVRPPSAPAPPTAAASPPAAAPQTPPASAAPGGA